MLTGELLVGHGPPRSSLAQLVSEIKSNRSCNDAAMVHINNLSFSIVTHEASYKKPIQKTPSSRNFRFLFIFRL